MDNAGIDLVLGIMPFTVELLKSGCKVICCSNTKPALNDVTNKECEKAFNLASRTCVELDKAIHSNRLLFYESGGEGPCLDLRKLNKGKYILLTVINHIVFQGERDYIRVR